MICKLLFIRPSIQWSEQVMSYKEEMAQNGDSFDGCPGLEDVHSYRTIIKNGGVFEKNLRSVGFTLALYMILFYWRI